ncbi:MAG: hypothetical protein WC777_04690 [Candidatus Gracilibacteria bacterium]|jgi:hypothetical protein
MALKFSHLAPLLLSTVLSGCSPKQMDSASSPFTDSGDSGDSGNSDGGATPPCEGLSINIQANPGNTADLRVDTDLPVTEVDLLIQAMAGTVHYSLNGLALDENLEVQIHGFPETRANNPLHQAFPDAEVQVTVHGTDFSCVVGTTVPMQTLDEAQIAGLAAPDHITMGNLSALAEALDGESIPLTTINSGNGDSTDDSTLWGGITVDPVTGLVFGTVITSSGSIGKVMGKSSWGIEPMGCDYEEGVAKCGLETSFAEAWQDLPVIEISDGELSIANDLNDTLIHHNLVHASDSNGNPILYALSYEVENKSCADDPSVFDCPGAFIQAPDAASIYPEDVTSLLNSTTISNQPYLNSLQVAALSTEESPTLGITSPLMEPTDDGTVRSFSLFVEPETGKSMLFTNPGETPFAEFEGQHIELPNDSNGGEAYRFPHSTDATKTHDGELRVANYDLFPAIEKEGVLGPIEVKQYRLLQNGSNPDTLFEADAAEWICTAQLVLGDVTTGIEGVPRQRGNAYYLTDAGVIVAYDTLRGGLWLLTQDCEVASVLAGEDSPIHSKWGTPTSVENLTGLNGKFHYEKLGELNGYLD